MHKMSFSRYFLGLVAFISYIDQNIPQIKYFWTPYCIMNLKHTELILVYRVGNKYVGCNMQKTPFSWYFNGLHEFIIIYRPNMLHKLYTSGYLIIILSFNVPNLF